ncbi:MAG TPA: hypothetical protein PKW05_04370 [Anaerolineae bacterium]|nr:hypothetical protein [Anaerolineae bacterium]
METQLPKDVQGWITTLQTGSENQRLSAIGDLMYHLSFQSSKDERIVNALIDVWAVGGSQVRAKAYKALSDLHVSLPGLAVEQKLNSYFALPETQRPRDCPVCGAALPSGTKTEACPGCRTELRFVFYEKRTSYPRVTDPTEVLCFAAQETAPVMSNRSTAAEELYRMGWGDILPLKADAEAFFEVVLPGGETGYVEKVHGVLLPVGAGDVSEPLGYVRARSVGADVGVEVDQPDGRRITISTLSREDRLPVVAERETDYLVQLKNRARGWVQKRQVVRTLSPTSTPEPVPPDVAETSVNWGAVGAVVGLLGTAVLGTLGAALGDSFGTSEDTRTRRAVDDVLRQHGL